jgi:5-formyltetrahydrofolate cyclo-ligase
MARDFANKSAARRWGWDRLAAEGVARFSSPPHGCIPNFAGAELAAARLLEIEPWKSATAIKINPDSPQRPLRAEALRRGITVFVPTPRLRGGFKKLDPRRIPPDKIQEATSLSRGDRWSEEIALANMPCLDAIVCGSVAVTRDGRRYGKGEGYSDLEFAILRELSSASACGDDRARSADRRLRAPRPHRSAAQCDRDANPRYPHQAPRRISTGRASPPRTLRKCRSWPNSRE